MSKHTQGPWVIYPETDGHDICAVDNKPGLPIRQLVARVERPNHIANARLIAAAPEMRPIVEAVAALYFAPTANDETPVFGSNGAYITVGHIKAARAAIAKAEGRT